LEEEPMKTRIAPVVVLICAPAIAACSSPPDPAAVQALTDGYWHSSLGPNEFLYELSFADGRFGGAVHMIEDGRQLTLTPITDVSLDGASIEIRVNAFPPYEGQVDLEAGLITGGHPKAQGYQELNLVKVPPDDWPMVQAKPQPAPGGREYVWTRPADRDDGWKTGAPAEVDIDPAAIDRFVGAILDGEAGALHSLLMVRDGRLVVEEYFHGWEVDDLHRIASCTKSVSSLLVGIAIDQGKIDGVDVPLLDFFPERRAGAGEGWEAIRLEHLLTMSMGLDWTDREADAFTPPGKDRLAEVIRRNVRKRPGTSWRYVSRDTNLLSGVIRHATGMHADVFAAEHLFAPIGITSWDWENNKYEGHPGMSGTLKLRPRDMAKLGQLVLDHGSWNGREVVSPEWIRESTRAQFRPPPVEEYGYLWRGFDEPLPSGIDHALGIGTQVIAVVPDFRLVVVATGGNDYNDKLMALFAVGRQHLLPGLR
jgi:CubicO group peptidase (beta-lactamase class C family)